MTNSQIDVHIPRLMGCVLHASASFSTPRQHHYVSQRGMENGLLVLCRTISTSTLLRDVDERCLKNKRRLIIFSRLTVEVDELFPYHSQAATYPERSTVNTYSCAPSAVEISWFSAPVSLAGRSSSFCLV